jgi:type VI secretion system secreted protein Hcp
MDRAVRTSIRTSLAVALVVTALGVGYIARGGSSSAGRAPAKPATTHVRKFSASDLLLAASTAQGIHMRYAGVTTGALTPDHANDIPIQSFQFGVARAFSTIGGTRTGSTPSVSEITLTHQEDAFSMPLLNLSLRGAVAGATANLYFTNLSGAGGTPFDFLEIALTQTVLSSFSMSSGGDVPSESISLNFTKMTFKYRVAGTTTVQTVTWNLVTGS